MLFSDDFLHTLRTDPVQGTIDICQITRNQLTDDEQGWSEHDYAILTETYVLLLELSEVNLLPVQVTFFGFNGNIEEDCRRIYNFLVSIEEECLSEASKLRLSSLRSHFKTSLGYGFCYEFSQGDIERIQLLINELRNHISTAINFEKDHQQRLLMRLEKLQSEVHKKVSDLDRFWGLIGDAGVVLGKIGNDAKPIVDRIREIADIVWRTQARSEELPSGTRPPMLEEKTREVDH